MDRLSNAMFSAFHWTAANKIPVVLWKFYYSHGWVFSEAVKWLRFSEGEDSTPSVMMFSS
jgi:hypothetical protein